MIAIEPYFKAPDIPGEFMKKRFVFMFCLLFAGNCFAFDQVAVEKLKAIGECYKCDLTGGSFASFDLTLGTLEGSDFSGCDLKGAKIKDGIQCNFSGANLTKFSAENANIDEAVFNNANLTNTNFIKAYIHSGSFNGSNLTNADFKRANLIKGKFNNAIIEKTNFMGSKLAKADFKDAVINEANFSYADLSEVDFYRMNLGKSTFRGANLSRVTLETANVNKVDFSGADLSSVYWGKGYQDVPLKVTCKKLIEEGAIIDSFTKCER